jgi:hypothetical protein
MANQSDYLAAFTTQIPGKMLVRLLTSFPAYPYSVEALKQPTYPGYTPGLLQSITLDGGPVAGQYSVQGEAIFVFAGSGAPPAVVAIAVTLTTIPETLISLIKIPEGPGRTVNNGQNVYTLILTANIPSPA